MVLVSLWNTAGSPFVLVTASFHGSGAKTRRRRLLDPYEANARSRRSRWGKPDGEIDERARWTKEEVQKVALYMNPPVNAAVFAVDEKPQIQALNRAAPTLPMLPPTPARATHGYEGNGTCDFVAALEVATLQGHHRDPVPAHERRLRGLLEQGEPGGAEGARRG
jgi:hypothetical protein